MRSWLCVSMALRVHRDNVNDLSERILDTSRLLSLGAVAVVGAGVSIDARFPMIDGLEGFLWSALDADVSARVILAAVIGRPDGSASAWLAIRPRRSAPPGVPWAAIASPEQRSSNNSRGWTWSVHRCHLLHTRVSPRLFMLASSKRSCRLTGTLPAGRTTSARVNGNGADFRLSAASAAEHGRFCADTV